MKRFLALCVAAVLLSVDCLAEELFSILPEAVIGGDDAHYSVLEYDDDIVIDSGDGWDSGDVLNPSVIKVDGTYYNYYSGWDGETWKTGLATSEDGKSWNKVEDYILDVRQDAWDDAYIAANGCAVLWDGRVYYFYHGASSIDDRARIGLAISDDMVSFGERTNQPVMNLGKAGDWDDCGAADPYVISYGGKLYMYYLGMDRLGVQRLGVAVSEDGYTWAKYKNNPILDVGVRGAFDEYGLGEPCVTYCKPYFYMLYTGRNATDQRNLGVAVSRDGVNWKKLNHDGIIELADNTWDSQVVCDPTWVENDDGTYTVWYGGGNVASPDQNLNGKIGVFTMALGDGTDPSDFNANFTMALGDGTDLSSFDANTWDYGDHRDYISGVWEMEGDAGNRFVWASEKVDMVMKNDTASNSVVIRGYVNMDMYTQIEVDRLELTVQLDGESAGSLEISETGVFEMKVDKPSALGQYLALTINASAFINHKALGDGEDIRNLSWILNSITQE